MKAIHKQRVMQAWGRMSPAAQLEHVLALTVQRDRAEALVALASTRLAEADASLTQAQSVIVRQRRSLALLVRDMDARSADKPACIDCDLHWARTPEMCGIPARHCPHGLNDEPSAMRERSLT